MSYKLDKPYTDDERADFIVLHNHNNRRLIEETDDAIYALEPGEKLENGEVVPDTDYPARQLAEAKAAKLAQNKESYEAALKSGVAYKNTLFDCDTLAAVRIMGQMVATQSAAIAQEETIDWFDYDYKPVTLTIPEFMELAGLVTLNTRRIETLNCAFNTAIENASTMEELEAIEISYQPETQSGDEDESQSTQNNEETDENTTGDELPEIQEDSDVSEVDSGEIEE